MTQSREHDMGSVTAEFMVPALTALDDPRVLGLEAVIHRREAILGAISFAASRFLGTADWDRDIRDVLASLGTAAEVSRVYLYAAYRDERGALRMRMREEWVAPGAIPFTDDPARCDIDIAAAGLERWAGLERGDVFDGPITSFVGSERAYFDTLGIRSIALVPIFAGGGWWGFLGFAHDVIERQWSRSVIECLRAAAATLGAAIYRKRVEETLREDVLH